MKRYFDLITWRFLPFVIMFFLALTFLGCHDPMIADMENERREIGFMVERELQRCRNASQVTSQSVSLPPAQAADMSAERRELDRMVEQGMWRNLSPVPPASQTGTFHPAP